MFAKLFAFFALLVVALASPKPQYLSYPAAGVAPLAYSTGYNGYPYSAAYASPYTAAYPYAYSGAYYVR